MNMNDVSARSAVRPRTLIPALLLGLLGLMPAAEAVRISLSANPSGGGTVYIYNNDTGAESGPAATASDTNAVTGNLLLVTASPAGGYIFRGWTVIPTAIPTLDTTATSDTFTCPNANRILQANFAQGALITVGVSDPALGDVQYQNLTTGLNSGLVDTFTDNAALNDQITIRVFPAPGAVFFRWSGDVDPAIAGNNPISIVADGQPKGIVAVFYASDFDTDGDGMTDGYEIQNGLNVTNGLDAGADFDGDGLSNIQEFQGPFGFAQTRAGLADTDADGLWDGWEAYFGVDPNDPLGDNGPEGNTDGDEVFSVPLGVPIRPFNNQEEYDFFINQNGGPIILTNGLAAFLGIAGKPGKATKPTPAGVGAPAVAIVDGFDTDTDLLPDGWEYTYTLLPISATGIDGAQGNPDGDMNYDTAPNGGPPRTAGLPINPYTNLEEYNRYLAKLVSPNPISDDSDADGMPDGWEEDMGLDSMNDAGAFGAGGNPDGDHTYGADGGCNGDFNNAAEFTASATSIRGATTHPTNPDVDGDRMPDNWEMTFAYDAWYSDTDGNGTPDGAENPDGDWMADDGAGVHVEVLLANGFDARTSYAAGYDDVWWFPTFLPYNNPAPFTRAYVNLDELWGMSALGGATPGPTACTPGTNPRSNDTDADGIHDGWENYVGLNARSFAPKDADFDFDGDGLINRREFECYEVGYGSNAGWENKIWPSDPFDGDTDLDQLADGLEAVVFNYAAGTPFGRNCYPGGGLNPCSADTDGDHIPDAWEHAYRFTTMGGPTVTNILIDPFTGEITTNLVTGRDGMDGTLRDASPEEPSHLDFDHDGLDNYQEYWAGAVYHWQYPDWTPGLGYGGYDPFDFFPGQPHIFDWQYWADVVPSLLSAPDAGGFGTPWNYMLGIAWPTRVRYSCTDPNDWDTDFDQMDDYWETYHGLNPIFGGYDIYLSKFVAPETFVLSELPLSLDVRINPYFAGHPYSDSDQDGLPNSQEALIPNLGPPDYYHTDPSPLWLTDASYSLSFPNLYFTIGTVPWYFSMDSLGAPPDYVYTYEHNEGYDTDNDNLGDRGELVDSVIPGSTDPLSAEDPINRRALYLNGNAAARSRVSFGHLPPATFEQFTVEAWVRPENPASGQTQVVVERISNVPNGNVAPWPDSLRLNLQLGIDPAGLPYVAYNGGGYDVIFVEAKAPTTRALPANAWTHLAGVYDAVASKLFLYVNGDLVATTPSAERPFNGYILPYLFSSPLVVGAHDTNPASIVSGDSIFGPIPLTLQPALQNFFQGWVDEVRVWDGARDQAAIRGTMGKTLRRAQVIASEFTPTPLLYLFNFDELPDPDHDPVSPIGFPFLNGRPNDGSYPGVPWWRTAADRSVVYNDYLYVPWIENSGTRRPLNTPADTVYWSMNATGGLAATNDFPNSSNPYNFFYLTAVNLGGTSFEDVFNDLLPLRYAVADEDIELWDGLGSGVQNADADGDGLPDDWETANGLDPHNGQGNDGPNGDPDGDGVNNLNEYLAGTDPWAVDSNGNGIDDGNDDSDGDKLSNKQEQDVGTLPGEIDTDDDGLTDFEEAVGLDDPVLTPGRAPTSYSDPANSLDPPILRSMQFDGASKLVVPPQDKFMSQDWTVQAWVNPTSSPPSGVDGVVICRYVADLVTSEFGINYELGVTGMGDPDSVMPYARYRTKDGSEVRVTLTNGIQLACAGGIPVNEWTQLTATYDVTNHVLVLFVNGQQMSYRLDATLMPPTVYGPGSMHLGDEVTVGAQRSTPGDYTGGFAGYIDEVKFFTRALVTGEVVETYSKPGAIAVPRDAYTLPFRNGFARPQAGTDPALVALPPNQTVHAIVQFTSGDQAQHLVAMQAAGVAPVNRVSGRAYTVSGTRQQILAVQGQRWSGLVPPDVKISPKVAASADGAGHWVAVQFYNGTPLAQALAAVDAAGGVAYRDRYFAGTYMLVQASSDQLAALAANDKVVFAMPSAKYMFEDKVTLMNDEAGRLASAPFAVQGEGWDGPGRGPADLLYYFVNGTPDLDTENEILPAQMEKWADVAALTFTETDRPGQDFGIDIKYAAGAQGVPYPFDGPGGILAYAFYPNDINTEPIAGDLFVDEDETWVDFPTAGIGPDFDLRFVALHELGHSLGMGHSDDPTAIMAPFYQAFVEPELQPDDIAGILTLYGEQSRLVEALMANFRFDDDGVTAEDFTEPQDWLLNWRHAGKLQGNARFSTNAPPLEGDTDADGMPDWWEAVQGLNPRDDDSALDRDQDGLYNITEYKAGTHPNRADSDLDGILDYDEDSDGDGLSNGSEQDNASFISHPGLVDTDDDGRADNLEVIDETDPSSALSPFVIRALEFGATGGVGKVTIPDRILGQATGRFNLDPWTLECLVRPAAIPTGVANISLLNRVIECNGLVEFDVGLHPRLQNGATNLYPYVRINGSGGGNGFEVVGGSPLAMGDWTHLAARMDTNEVLTLLVDGFSVGSYNTGLAAIEGLGDLVLGGNGYIGQLKEVRVWQIARTDEEIREFKDRTLFFDNSAADAGILRVTGDAGHLRQVATTQGLGTEAKIDGLESWTLDCWVKTADAGGLLMARSIGSDPNNNTDFNYAMGLDGQGRLFGRFSIDWAAVCFDAQGNATFQFGTDHTVNTLVGAKPVNDNAWHHVAYVRDETNAFLYVDGELDATQPGLFIPGVGANCFVIDAAIRTFEGPTLHGKNLAGDLDELRVWRRPLRFDEINKLKTHNLLGNESGLVSYFNFDSQRGKNADERAVVRDNTTEFARYIVGASHVRGGNAPIRINPLWVYSRVALAGYYSADDGGADLDDFMFEGDRRYAGRLADDVRFVTVTNAPYEGDSDGDGLPDSWETLHGLDPSSDAGSDGAWGDPDGDGLNNRSEFLAGTDPRDFDTRDIGRSDYDATNSYGATNGELFDDGDGMADSWEALYPAYVSPLLFDALSDPDLDGWSNLAEFMFDGTGPAGQAVLRTDPGNNASYPTPMVTFEVRYAGLRTTGPLVITAYREPGMDGRPDAVLQIAQAGALYHPLIVTTNLMTTGHLHEGANYFFAWIDNDGNGAWSDGEPAGIAQGQPLQLGWGPLAPVLLGLTDALPGYQRIAWTAQAGVSSFTVRVVRTTSAGSPVVMVRTNLRDRTYLHEGDYLYAGQTIGLDPGGSFTPGYVAYVDGSTVTTGFAFSMNWSKPIETPRVLEPLGEVVYARHSLVWTQDVTASMNKIEIYRGAPGGSPTILNSSFLAPYRLEGGLYQMDDPALAGDAPFTNGVYYWRVTSMNAARTSTPSPYGTFTANLQISATGAYAIAGTLSYFGKVTNGNFVVQAYTSEGFSGTPDAQVSLGTNRGPFSLRGLRAGTYRVRGFLDQNGNRKPDASESIGFVRTTLPQDGFYEVKAFQVPGNALNEALVIRDRDTDNDNLPDSWEIMWFGNLTTAAPGPVVSSPAFSDYDGDGVNDLKEYYLGTNPTATDSDGDGLNDGAEYLVHGTSPGAVDSDGDGLSDGDEVLVRGSNPLARDTDADGAPDGIEAAAGSGLNKADTDNDGYADALEIILGSGPTNAASRPAASALLEILSVRMNGNRSAVDYNFPRSVTNVLFDVDARLAVGTNLVGGARMPVPGSSRIIPRAQWTTGPWTTTNANSGANGEFYWIQWNIP
jgi:hypothetical protein